MNAPLPAHADGAGVRPIGPVDQFQERTLAHSRRALDRHHFAGRDRKAQIAEDRNLDAALKMKPEALRQTFDGENGRAHVWSTEETSSCV